MKDFPRIIFFGTPVFAVPSIRSLVKVGYPVVAVVTAPDKPSGRGLKVLPSPVKVFATEHGIPVLQPANMKDPAFLESLQSYNPDLQIVIAFRMMPRAVWALPRLGTFNLHASLLPQYRGAAPINWAVINGESATGLTTFLLNEDIDTGNILLRADVPVGPDETAGELHDRMMIIGSELVKRTVEGLAGGRLQEIKQEAGSEEILRRAPKIFRADCRISWERSTLQIHNLVRGLSPYPGAFTEFKASDGSIVSLKILRAFAQLSHQTVTPGLIEVIDKDVVRIAAPDGFLVLQELQVPGRKVMNNREFISGYRDLVSGTHCF